MNNYNQFIVTFYADIISCIILFVLFVLSAKNTLIQKTENILFRILLSLVALMAVLILFLYGMGFHAIPGSGPLATWLQTGTEISIDLLIYFWLVYVNYRVYHSLDHIRRNRIKFMAPALFFIIMDFINAFTGIFFRYDEDITYHTTAAYYFVYLIKYAMFFGAILQLIIHKSRKLDDMKFFSVWPFLIPTITGLVLSIFTPYLVSTLGFAIGYALLYAAILNECRYLDRESGFKNGRSLSLMKDLIRNGKYEPESLIYIRTDAGDIKAFSGILASQLIDGCETFRVGEKEFLILTKVTELGPLRMLSTDISEALEEVGYSCDMDIKLRKRKESGEEFIKNQLVREV